MDQPMINVMKLLVAAAVGQQRRSNGYDCRKRSVNCSVSISAIVCTDLLSCRY